MKLSIIIPVFNMEQYLRRCLDSVVSLTMEDYEIIVINDGSVDGTAGICNEYAEIYPHVKVVHQENRGLNLTRETGLSEAEGRLICFLDADDWLDKSFFDTAVRTLDEDEEIDIFVSGLLREYPDGLERAMFKKPDNTKPLRLDRENAIEEMVRWRYFGWHAGGKIYRSHLFSGNRWFRDIQASEDLLMNYQVFLKSRTVCLDQSVSYHYYYNANSLTAGQDRFRRYESNQRAYEIILKDADFSNKTARKEVMLCSLRKYIEEFRESIFVEMDEGESRAGRIRERIQERVEQLRQYDGVEFPQICTMIIENLHEVVQSYRDTFVAMRSCAKEICERSEKTYIYGTGLIADFLARMMKEDGVEYAGFIISDGQPNPQSFCEKTVAHLSDVQLDMGDVVLLFLQERTRRVVEPFLRERGTRYHAMTFDERLF